MANDFKGALIGPQFYGELKQTIARVNATPYGDAATRIPTRFEDGPAPATPPIRLAAYPRTTSWKQGSTAQVTFYTHSGTAYGLATTDASGTATALNVCGDFLTLPNGDQSEKIGPTPTMTWCIISKSRGGANVAVEGPQKDTKLAAYPLSEGPWQKGESRKVAYYAVVNGQVAFTGETVTAGNVAQEYYPLSTASQGTATGPTPSMAWCIVSQNSDGNLLVTEAENAPLTRLGTVAQNEWSRGSLRTVKGTSSTQTYDVYNAFDNYSGLDLPHGVAFTKSISPAGDGQTAHVLIGPPPIPLHAAKYQNGGDWQRDEERVITVLPSASVTQSRQIVAVNKHFDTIEASDKPLAIGKIGTAYHVIAGPAGSSIKVGSRTDFGDRDYFWQRGSTWFIDPVGSEQPVPVKSVFDTYTHLDLHHGVAFVKAKDPDNVESTVNIVISPAPIPMYEATTEQTGTWNRNDEKILVVPPSGNRNQPLEVNVTNKFFEDIDLEGKPIAIGKFNDQFFALTGGGGSKVNTGKLATPIASTIPVQPGDYCYVTPAGGGPVVEVKSVFDAYTVLDLPNGLAYAKAKDPDNAEQTVNIVISPAPIPMHEATTEDTSPWERNAERLMTVPPYFGRQNPEQVSVTNKFFDTIDVDSNPLAIGKFGDQFFALTGGSAAGVKFADRTDSGQWEKGSQRDVRIHGTTTDVQAYNLVGHYEEFDGRGSGGVPGVVIAKGKDLGGGEGTAYYLVAPSPIVFATGSFSGTWGKGESKSIQLDGLGTSPYSVIVQNDCFPIARPTNNCKVAVAKKNNSWHLVATEFETSTAVFIRSTASQTILGTAATSTITFVGTGATSRLTYYDSIGTATINFLSNSSTSNVTVVTNVQASLNTQTCAIGISLTTQEVKTVSVSGTQTATTITSVAQKTATLVSMSGTQTATSISMSGTQTMTFVTGTFTATFLKIKDQ